MTDGRKLTILVDMDDTVENFCETWVKHLNRMYKRNVRYEDIYEWSIGKFYPGLTNKELYAPLKKSSFWKSVKPFGDAQYYLKRLIDEGHSVYIVTASHRDTISRKLNLMFLKNFPFIKPENIIICQKKQMVIGDILVDDAPHNLEGGVYKGVLFDAPHNRYFDNEEKGIKRAMNWAQVYSIIRNMTDAPERVRNK